MKIAILYPSYRALGGAEEYLTYLVKTLREFNHEVTVYIVGKIKEPYLTSNVTAKIIKIPETGSIYDMIEILVCF